MDQNIQNLLTAVKQWVNDKQEKLSLVISAHLNQLDTKVENRVKLVRLFQSEYDTLVNEGTVDEMTLYIVSPDPIIEVTATFIDENGTTLYTQTINSGETPVYGGIAPSKEDVYDQTEDIGTEYNWDSTDGWYPTISPITQDTTYTVKYTERQFRYVYTNEKWVREDGTTIDSTKNYLMVGDLISTTSTTPSDLDLCISMDESVVSGGYRYKAGELYFANVNTSFKDFTEFGIDEAYSPITPTTFLQLETIGGGLYIKDKVTNKYIGTTASANKFSCSTSEDPTTLGKGYRWEIDANGEIYNSTNKRYARLHHEPTSNSVWFAPYKTGQLTTYLYYQHADRVKEYIDEVRTFSLRESSYSSIPTVSEDVQKGRLLRVFDSDGPDSADEEQ